MLVSHIRPAPILSFPFGVNVSFFCLISAIGPSCKTLLDAVVPPKDGEHVIYPAGDPVTVYCDMTTDGGKSNAQQALEQSLRVMLLEIKLFH